MDTRNLLSLSGVLLVIGAAGYFWGLDQKEDAPLLVQDNRPRPDYVVEGLQSLQTDEKGHISRTIRAKKLTHYQEPEEQAEMEHPDVILFRDGKPAWSVKASRGSSLEGNTHLILGEGVSAERLNASPEGAVRLDAPTMHLYPEKQSINTADDVSVVSRIGKTQARGLDASLQSGSLNLHSQVRGEYVLAR